MLYIINYLFSKKIYIRDRINAKYREKWSLLHYRSIVVALRAQKRSFLLIESRRYSFCRRAIVCPEGVMIILQRQWGSFLHGALFEIVDYYTLPESRWSRVKFELDPEESRHSYSLLHSYGNLVSISTSSREAMSVYPTLWLREENSAARFCKIE